ncbi:hypothetical protein BWI17_01955 [Betaproteobacteria bacterium GR16-43]|nr:hypothetical protein BWI17_01955 [Betaproteobacteria bacterium GR16-43]
MTPQGPVNMFFRLALVLTLLAASPALAQPSAHRVAYLSTLSAAEAANRITGIEKAVAARMPGERVDYRTFRYELPVSDLPADSPRSQEIRSRNDAEIGRLLDWKPDVILAPGALPAKAAARRTSTVPIVFACKCNPLSDGFGLVRDAERPEANVTGFTRYLIDSPDSARDVRLNLHEKRLELLREFVRPQPLTRVAAIHGDAYDEAKWRYAQRAEGMRITWVPVRLTDANIESLPQLLREARVEAGLVLADTFLDKHTRRLVKTAAAIPLPILFPWDEADLGAWMHYGTVVDFPGTTAYYLQKLLTGTRVADLPVRFPDKTELAFNLKTARAHGWTGGKRGSAFEAEVDRWIAE